MKTFYFAYTWCYHWSFFSNEKAIFELYDSSDLDVRAKSNGSFESIDISITTFPIRVIM